MSVFSSISDAKPKSSINNKRNVKFIREMDRCPFELLWSFGVNPEVPIITMSIENRTIIAYACSHMIILYDYESKDMKSLVGHRNCIRTLSTSQNCKWLLSADFNDDYTVIVWDTKVRLPVYALFNPHGNTGISAAKISPDGNFIITVGCEKYQMLKWWSWTDGQHTCNALIELSNIETDRVKDISFNTEACHDFVLTMNHSVIFGSWNNNTLLMQYPEINIHGCETFNNSTFISNANIIATGTNKGNVFVWSNEVHKEHRKTIHLEKKNITQIIDLNGILVTVNVGGEINFYDSCFRILCWCTRCNLESIKSINFDRWFKKDKQLGITSNGNSLFTISSGKILHKKYFEKINVEGECNLEIENEKKENEKMNRQQVHSKTTSYPFELQLSKKTMPLWEILPAEQFFICTTSGKLLRFDLQDMKYYILNSSSCSVTAIDINQKLDYVVIGNAVGELQLYNYTTYMLMICCELPNVTNLLNTYKQEVLQEKINYVSCPQINKTLKAISSLSYSMNGEMLACGMENGVLWILDSNTLNPLDKNPFKHSSEAIFKIAFSTNSKYMAYVDNSMKIAVFKRNESSIYLWHFLGKYRSHYLPIIDILFDLPVTNDTTPRLLSLGEDRNIIEYDLESSGPYPHPGLQIQRIKRIESRATPVAVAWYRDIDAKQFLIISNSEYKLKLLDAKTFTPCATFLGPKFTTPIKCMKVLRPGSTNNTFMIFTTVKEIGMILLPYDGNPYKVVGMTGHPQQVVKFCVNFCNKIAFTIGCNDHCVLMWRINFRTLEGRSKLGGIGISPFYPLIDGGENGWFFKEMQDLFYYGQILQQGESTILTRTVSNKISIKQLCNLFRTIGFFLTNEEMKNILSEVSCQATINIQELEKEITFEEFVKLYINYQPVFGISRNQIKKAFSVLGNTEGKELFFTKHQYLNILTGNVYYKDKLIYGEPLSIEEVHTYLSITLSHRNGKNFYHNMNLQNFNFEYLSKIISYKDFTADTMGIESPRETKN